MKNRNKNKQAGFTLVELLVVLVIIGALSAIFSKAIFGYTEKAKSTAIYEITHQINNEIVNLGQLHGVGPSAANAGIVNSGNNYLDVLVYGDTYVDSEYATAYKYEPHAKIGGLHASTAPSSGTAGEYTIEGQTITIGSSTDQNDYTISDLDESTLAAYVTKYAPEMTFTASADGGTADELEWTYSSGLYELTITFPFSQ